ncbi:putative efflux protein, MATE family [Desulfoluna spongiiphila]|uniref:Multidrug export protein MepA n=2 Tax=Desulfoluna spongiiphila TaxID=419481 RepID=A0A1G5IB15_9BACT|nr:putative efflux protein, MATE family [Desulfoluna spongiiphila]
MEEHFKREWSMGDFLRFVTPSILSIITISLYMVVDGLFVSRYIGSLALAAMNIIMPLFSFCFGIGIMVAAGSSAIIGIELGEGHRDRANRHFSLAFVSLVVVAVAILVLLKGVGVERISRLLGATDTLLPYCSVYLKAFGAGLAAVVLQIFFEFFIRLDGKPVWAFYITLAGGFTNILLDYLLIVRLDMGLHGAGVASATGIGLSGVIGAFYFLKRSVSLTFTRPKLDVLFLRNTVLNGSSEMVSEIASGVKTLVFNLVIITYAGEKGVAALSIIMYLYFLLSSLYIGLSMGVAPVLSFNYGARNVEKLKGLIAHSCRVIGVTSLATFVFTWVWGGQVIRLFAEGQPEVTALAQGGLRIVAFTFLLNGISIFCSAFFTSVNNGKISALLTFLRTFVFTLGFVWLLPPMLGISGIWLSVPAAELATLAVSLWFARAYRGVYLSPGCGREAVTVGVSKA